jgi:uncharacterized membrane protein YeaQ/YmgE (transglycosylase-associated protein family)
MVIIDLMTAFMGVTMGFLAFLLIGGVSGASAWIFYPGTSSRSPNPQRLLLPVLVGFIAAVSSSYLGQYLGFFQSGQMLEWLCAIFASCLVGCIFTALAK